MQYAAQMCRYIVYAHDHATCLHYSTATRYHQYVCTCDCLFLDSVHFLILFHCVVCNSCAMHVQWPRHVHVCTVCGVFAQVLVTGVSRPGLGPVWGAVMSVSTCKESCRSNNWHHVATGGWVSWSAGFNRTATPCGSQCNGFVGHAKPHM